MAQATRVHSTPPTSTSPTRRAFVNTIAALPIAAAAPAAAAHTLDAGHAADPTFDLIDLHRKAEAAHLAAIKELSRFEESGDCEHDWITEKPCHDEFDAFDALVGAAATTLPGVFAKVVYLREIAEREAWMLDQRPGTAIRLIESFATSIQNISVEG
jgi:hypothetical protein